MKHFGILFILTFIFPQFGSAQISSKFEKFSSTPLNAPRNVFANMVATHQVVYLGSSSGLYRYNGIDFEFIESGTDSLDKFGIYSVSADSNRVFFSTGTIKEVRGDQITTGVLYGFSEDGGQTWKSIPLPLDNANDTTYSYGQNRIETLPIIVPEQFVTYDSFMDDDTLWVATWSGGHRQSTDGGQTWTRILLPPDDLDFLSPDSTYDFFFSPVPRQGKGGGDLNFLGFSIHKTNNGILYAGSAGGINKRINRNQWQKYKFNGSPSSLPGNWITHINSQNFNGIERVWAVCWRAENIDEQFGLAYTDNHGDTWSQTLVGEKIYSVGFVGDTVIATGQNGIFISSNGKTWNFYSRFTDQESGLEISFADFYDVAFFKTKNQLIVGSSDGLMITNSDQLDFPEWTILRRDLTTTGNKSGIVIYPNPFSPDDDEMVRISFEKPPPSGDLILSVYSNDLYLVFKKTFAFNSNSNTIEWNGRDQFGHRLSNGVYMIFVESNQSSITKNRGKLLILE